MLANLAVPFPNDELAYCTFNIPMFGNMIFILFQIEGCCYSNILKTSNPCIEWALLHDCPVCFDVIRLFLVIIYCLHFILCLFLNAWLLIFSICLNQQMM